MLRVSRIFVALTTTTASLALLAGATGCGSTYVDDDHKNDLARQVILDMKVVDGLDVDAGDRVDFKRVTPLHDGKVTLKIVVGDPWKDTGHKLTGQAAVYTQSVEMLAKKTIQPSERRYALEFPGEAHVSYVLKLEGVSGKAKYSIEYSQEQEAKDPCANVSCQANQRCEEGECVAVEVDTPAPATKACPGGCPRGHFCQQQKRKCVKRPCFGVKCGAGKYCSRGKCRRKSTSTAKPKGCSPKCRKGWSCKGRKCIKNKGPAGPVSTSMTGPISASVINVQPQGGKSLVLLGRGRKHNVKKGDKGTIGKFSFRVVSVFPTRCRVRVNAPAAALAGKKRARIVRR